MGNQETTKKEAARNRRKCWLCGKWTLDQYLTSYQFYDSIEGICPICVQKLTEQDQSDKMLYENLMKQAERWRKKIEEGT